MERHGKLREEDTPGECREKAPQECVNWSRTVLRRIDALFTPHRGCRAVKNNQKCGGTALPRRGRIKRSIGQQADTDPRPGRRRLMLNGNDLALACPRQVSPGRSKILLGTALGFAIAALDGARHRNAAAAS